MGIQNLAKSPAYRYQENFANKLLVNYINAWFAIFFLINSIGILFAVLLLVGIEKSKHGLMLPWMVLDMIGLVLCTIAVFVCFVITIGLIEYAPQIILCYLFYGIILAIGFYFWDVIFSVYRDIKKEKPNSEI